MTDGAKLYESCCVLIVFVCVGVGVNVFVCFVRGVLCDVAWLAYLCCVCLCVCVCLMCACVFCVWFMV